MLASPTAIPLAGPPALDSAQYAAEFAEVRDYGAAASVGDFVLQRTPEQTATALFHTIAPRFQHLEAIRDQITGRGLDIVDAAHALAVFDASLADVAIACWRAKYDFAFWRPVTAIALAAHRRQPGHRRRARLGAAAPDPALSRLRQRPRLLHRLRLRVARQPLRRRTARTALH